MTSPWEKYQQPAAKPWEKRQPEQPVAIEKPQQQQQEQAQPKQDGMSAKEAFNFATQFLKAGGPPQIAMDFVRGAVMPILAGGLAEPVAGIAGLGAEAIEGGKRMLDVEGAQPPGQAGADTVRAIQQGVQDIATPDSRAGQLGAQVVAESPVVQAVGDIYQAAEQGSGDVAFEATGSPLVGAAGATLPTAAIEAIPFVGQAARRSKQAVKQAPKKQITPEEQKKIAELEQEQAELEAAQEQGMVMTSDVKPPKTFVGKSLQKAGERVPIVGTGGKRAAQQTAREQRIDDFAGEFGIDPDSQFDADVVKSANEVFKESQKTASRLRKEAIDELSTHGDVDMQNARKAVDDAIAKETAKGRLADQVLLNELENIKAELNGDFRRIATIRSSVGELYTDAKGKNIAGLGQGSDTVIDKVYGAISKDMEGFAEKVKSSAQTKEARAALGKWKAQNRIFGDNFTKAKDAKLKSVLSKGEATPEVVSQVLRSGKRSDLQRLYNNLDAKGRDAAMKQIVQDAMKRSGWPDNPNPQKLLSQLNGLNTKEALKVFGKGKAGAELRGFKKYLEMTRRAQDAGVATPTGQEAVALGAAGATYVDPSLGGIIAGVGLLSRAYESAPVRRLFVKLENAKTQKQIDRIKGDINKYLTKGTDEYNSIVTAGQVASVTAAKEAGQDDE